MRRDRFVAIVITQRTLQAAASALALAATSAACLVGGWWVVQTAGGIRLASGTASGRIDIRQPIFQVPGAGQVAALAINVDWGEEFLPPMLDLFAATGVRATFFPTGRWAQQHADLVRRLAAAGHEVENHGAFHAHPLQLDEAGIMRLVTEGAAVVREITGRPTRLFAPPYGEWNAQMVESVASVGHYTILWTLDTIDWQRPPPERILQRILPRIQPGAIVLMHPTEPTVRALPALIEGIEAKGLKLLPVGEMIDRARGLRS